MTLKQAERLIKKYSKAIIYQNSNTKTAIMKVGNREFRMSIIYNLKSVVFTDAVDNTQVIKFYSYE